MNTEGLSLAMLSWDCHDMKKPTRKKPVWKVMMRERLSHSNLPHWVHPFANLPAESSCMNGPNGSGRKPSQSTHRIMGMNVFVLLCCVLSTFSDNPIQEYFLLLTYHLPDYIYWTSIMFQTWYLMLAISTLNKKIRLNKIEEQCP